MATLTLLGGAPGMGKSSVAPLLAEKIEDLVARHLCGGGVRA